MRPAILALTAAAAAALGSPTAPAANTGFYLGGALGQSESGLRSSNVNFSDRDSGYKLIAGWRPVSLFAAEFNYVDLGKAAVEGAQASTKAMDGFIVGYLPIPVVDIYGKLGLVSWKTDASASNLSLHISGSDPAAGAGVQLHFGALAARLEYEVFYAADVGQPTLLSLGLTYSFL